MEIQVLIENSVFQKRLVAEHGLSLLVRTEGREILLDTGQSGAFIQNAIQLGVDPGGLQKLVLSHGHYDHIGGLSALVKANPRLQVYAHRTIVEPKFALRQSGAIDEIGYPSTFYTTYEDHFRFIEEDTEIGRGIFVLTGMEQRHDTSVTTGNFLVEQGGIKRQDTFTDEVALVIQEGDGLHVLSGCSHSGIVNILETVMNRFPGYPIQTVSGGFHLRDMKRERILEIARTFADYGIRKICTGHCTGIEAYGVLKSVLGERLSYLSCGSLLRC